MSPTAFWIYWVLSMAASFTLGWYAATHYHSERRWYDEKYTYGYSDGYDDGYADYANDD